MSLDDAHPVQLTFNTVPDCCADWSPDGTKIVFASLRANNWDIYTLDLTTGQETRLTRDEKTDAHPSWSPDGNRIAFDSYRDGKPDIYIMNEDGSQQSRLTSDENENADPDWSPDGTNIAYTTVNYKGNPAANEEIFTMGIEEDRPVQLTKNEVQDLGPAWSPDGTRIAFSSTPSHKSDEYNLGIYVADLDGRVTQLTFDTTWETGPIWSMDGTKIAFTSCLPESSNTCAIHIMNADGSNPHRVTDLQYDAHVSAWSPDMKISVNPDCTAGWTRLAIGEYAAVAGQNDTPNRVRSGPSLGDGVITQVYPGTPLQLMEGPVCADGLIFWKVEHKSIPSGSGWTAEGDGSEYWLEPYTP
jgi:Tol biopolymer transport system component